MRIRSDHNFITVYPRPKKLRDAFLCLYNDYIKIVYGSNSRLFGDSRCS